uniref:terminase small subunit n=1 Tax=Aerococcus urinaeequi TaxID=51665 RepID=UPI00352BA50E
MEELTVDEKLFANEYVRNGRNGTRAAMVVRPLRKYDTAKRYAFDTVHKPNVQAYINELIEERLEVSKLSADVVIDELIRVGFGGTIYDHSRQIDNLRDEVVKDMSYERTAKVEDRIKALELLGKHMTLFDNKTQLDVSGTVNFIEDVPAEDD